MSDRHGRTEPQIIAFPRSPLEKSSEPPDPPDMLTARVTRLEEDVKELRADMKSVVRDMSFVRGRVEHLPTTWVLVTGVIGSQAALLGFVFAMLKYLVH